MSSDTRGRSVVQPWVQGLQIKEQSVLLLSLRGCDTAAKEDPGKLVTRALRRVVLHNGHAKPGSFMYEGPLSALHFVGADACPMHWYMHVVHAIEIVGYRHPIFDVSREFRRVYLEACVGLHLTPETLDEMDVRLSGDFDNPCDRDWEPML